MCDSRPYKIFFFYFYFSKKIYHTHKYIILHKKNMCNTFLQKTVDNFFILKNKKIKFCKKNILKNKKYKIKKSFCVFLKK
jgi:hypothetical protein